MTHRRASSSRTARCFSLCGSFLSERERIHHAGSSCPCQRGLSKEATGICFWDLLFRALGSQVCSYFSPFGKPCLWLECLKRAAKEQWARADIHFRHRKWKMRKSSFLPDPCSWTGWASTRTWSQPNCNILTVLLSLNIQNTAFHMFIR